MSNAAHSIALFHWSPPPWFVHGVVTNLFTELAVAVLAIAVVWWKVREGLKELHLPEGLQASQYKKVERVTELWQSKAPLNAAIAINWKRRLVSRLIGRDEPLANLRRWVALRKGRDFRICLVTGAAGSGKTRLAAELADALQRSRRFLWPMRHFRTIGFASEVGIETQLPAMIILDDQEMVREEVLKLLTGLARHEDVRHPVRILLICRTASTDAWRKAIQAEIALIDALEPRDLVLPPLEEEKATQLFLATLAALGMTAQEQQERTAFAEWLQTESAVRRLPLYTIAAAMARWADPNRALVGYTHGDVIQALVHRERERIRSSVSTNGRLRPEVAERLIAIASIRGSLTCDDLRRLSHAKLDIGLPDANTIVDDVRASGIVWRGKGDVALVAPEPQLLASILAWQVLLGEEIKSKAPLLIYHAII